MSQFLSHVFLILPETRGKTMLLFQYFQRSGKSQSKPSQFGQSLKNNLSENITGRELESIQESLLVTSARKFKRDVYDEKNKQEIAKYASTKRFAAVTRKFKPKFLNLNESMMRPWVKKYQENLKENSKQGQSSDFTPTIKNARGRPLLLDEELI